MKQTYDLVIEVLADGGSVTFDDWFHFNVGAESQIPYFQFGDSERVSKAELFNQMPVYTFATEAAGAYSGFEGTDWMEGNAGNDQFSGGSGDDQLRGEGGDDILNGGAGDDLLVGGPGNDQFTSDSGNDIYLYRLGDGNDIIDYGHGAVTGNQDVLHFENISIDGIRLVKKTYDLVIEVLADGGSVTFDDWFHFNVGAESQIPYFQFGKDQVLTKDQLFELKDIAESSSAIWSYQIIDPNELIDRRIPDYSSVETDISEWLTSAGPFANSDDHPFAGDFGFPLSADVVWPLNTFLWAASDIAVPAGSQLKLRVFADNYASLWVNGRQYLNRVGSDIDEIELIAHEVVIPAYQLLASNRVTLLAEDAGGLSYAHVEVSIITPPTNEQAHQINLAKACRGEMPSGIDYTAPVANPYEKASFYNDPDYAARVASTQEKIDDDALFAAMEMVKGESTAIWVDSVEKLCGFPNDGRMSLVEHLENARAIQSDTPTVVSTVVFNLPARDCVSGNHPGEFFATEEGFKGYQSFIDTLAAIAANYPELRIVTALEPGAIAASVDHEMRYDNITYCDLPFAENISENNRAYYRDGMIHAMQTFSKVPNIYTYLDVAHAAWLGWRIPTLAGVINEWVSLASNSEIADYSLISGFVTNMSEYIPYEEPFMLDERPEVFSFYTWNAAVSAGDYVQQIAEMMTEYTEAPLGFVVDSSRNGWGGAGRPAAEGYGQGFRVDRRVARWHWCNNALAGLGEFPQASPDENQPQLHAFYWFKPPGESDGDDKAERYNTYAERQTLDCSSEFRGAAPNPTAASAWFDDHFIQLIENAWPPLIEPAKPLTIQLTPTSSDIESLNEVYASFEIGGGTIDDVRMYLGGIEQALPQTAIWEGGYFEVPVGDIARTLNNMRVHFHVTDTLGQQYAGEFVVDNLAGFTGSNSNDLLLYTFNTEDSVQGLAGGDGDDVIISVRGAPQIDGGAGNDTLYGVNLFGGEGDDLIVFNSVEADHRGEGGAGNDDYRIDARFSLISIADLEGTNRIFMPPPEDGAVDEFYRNETDLFIYRMNANGFEEVIVTIEGYFTAQTFEGVYVAGQLVLGPDDQVPLLPTDDTSSSSGSSSSAPSVAAGRAEFEQQCAVCHVEGDAPNLIFTQLSGDDLIAKIDQTMPQRAPLSCEGDCAISVALFIEEELKPQAQLQF